MGLTFKKLSNYSCEDKETVRFSMKGINVTLSLEKQEMSIDLEQDESLHH